MKEGGGIPQRYKNMGFTHVGQKKQGDGQHKWKVLAKKGSQYKVVQGGYRGMQDFSQHHSKQRQSNFWSRMGGKNSSKAKDPFSPLYWHKRLGKWEDGGEAYDMDQMQTGGMMFREVAGGDISIPNLSKLQVGGYFPRFMEKGGEMIRRADGSYSQRGLWDNIRANKGSGKKPTKQMLKQERKIKSKEMKNGGTNNPGFKALPGYVQEKIISRMGDGGYTGTFSGNAYYQDGGEPNGSMALGQMSSVVDKLSKLREFVGQQDNLDPWIASKLAVMDHSADAISDYLMYNPEYNKAGGQQQEMMQMGGSQGGGQQEQIMQVIQAYAQIAQVDPKQIMQKLQSLPPEQQQKAVQQMVQAVQQAQQGGGQEQPMMRMGGGAPCYKCGGSYQYGGMTNEMGGSVVPAMPGDVYDLPSYNRGGNYGYMDPAWMKAGGIHINPANKGKFTASAKKAGMGVQQFASHVLGNKEDYSSTQVKRANFARNAAKWKKQDGGSMNMDQVYDLSNEQIQNLINQGYEIQYV
jgi:hypothetical protein